MIYMGENWVGGNAWRECAWRYGTLEFGSVCIDLLNRSVKRSRLAVHLTPIEYRLLPHTAIPHHQNQQFSLLSGRSHVRIMASRIHETSPTLIQGDQ